MIRTFINRPDQPKKEEEPNPKGETADQENEHEFWEIFLSSKKGQVLIYLPPGIIPVRFKLEILEKYFKKRLQLVIADYHPLNIIVAVNRIKKSTRLEISGFANLGRRGIYDCSFVCQTYFFGIHRAIHNIFAFIFEIQEDELEENELFEEQGEDLKNLGVVIDEMFKDSQDFPENPKND